MAKAWAVAVNPAVQFTAWTGIGNPTAGGVLIIADHASNFVPPDIDLGIAPELLRTHIALDIGVAEVARLLVDRKAADCAILGGVSRLVVDYNRDPSAPGTVPLSSDGTDIPGNDLPAEARAVRISDYHLHYHDEIAQLCAHARPAMILSLHSFTPALATSDAPRPWDIGVLYNQDDRLARLAIPALAAHGLNVGDQLPYSGKVLNYTMNRHAEGNGIPYLGLEMRQDRVRNAKGQAEYADIILHILEKCRNHLA